MYKPCIDAFEGNRYVTAFYASVILINGEGVRPKTDGEKLFASFILLLGFLIVAVIFGNVSMIISNLTYDETRYQRRMETLYSAMQHMCLPKELKDRIIMYYDAIWKDYRSLDGTITFFFHELSKSLNVEVLVYLRTHLILSVPFLRQCSPDVVQNLVLKLGNEVFLNGDYIVHMGTPGSVMYLICRGNLEVTQTNVRQTVAAKKKHDPRHSTIMKGFEKVANRLNAGRHSIIKIGGDTMAKGRRRLSSSSGLNANMLQRLERNIGSVNEGSPTNGDFPGGSPTGSTPRTPIFSRFTIGGFSRPSPRDSPMSDATRGRSRSFDFERRPTVTSPNPVTPDEEVTTGFGGFRNLVQVSFYTHCYMFPVQAFDLKMACVCLGRLNGL
jgi:hypothetical protein